MKISEINVPKIINNDYLEFTENDILTDTERESRELLESIENTEKSFCEFYNELLEKKDISVYEETVQKHQRSYRRASVNILESYRKITGMRDELSARWNDIYNSRKKKKLIPNIPANAEIDYAEKKTNHFAQGINIYKMIFICFIGSFAGVIIEMLWCLLKNGYIESRAGLVFGPFNLLYGVGAMALSVSLYRFRNRGGWLSFFGGMLVGGLVEYLCSWGQEAVFGSRSWDYSAMPFNINGRVCLLYSVFWGLLGYFWIKVLYPLTSKLILKIPNKVGKILSVFIVVFFVVNGVCTVIAVYRWAERLGGTAASGAFWSFVDSVFPNEIMEKIFANMKF